MYNYRLPGDLIQNTSVNFARDEYTETNTDDLRVCQAEIQACISLCNSALHNVTISS